MNRLGTDKLGWGTMAKLAIVGAVFLAMAGSEARAWYGYGYASYGGYYGGYASSYGCCDSYYVGGPFRRMATRIRARRAYRAYYRNAYWNCCGIGCYSTYCVPTTCCDPCCCDPCGCGSTVAYYSPATTCCGSDGGSVIYSEPAESGEVQPTPAEPTPYEPTPADPTPPEPNAADPNSTSINMILPSLAKVYVNDRATSSTGNHRSFISRGLRKGLHYSYNVRVEYEQDGKPVVHRRHLKLKAGDRVAIDFQTSPTDSSQLANMRQQKHAPETKVTLHVPEGAEVYLSGSATDQRGSTRQYLTTRLAKGELWKDYTVRVVLQKDGKTLTREKTLQVEGGQSYELAFEFNQQGPKLAMLTP